MISGALRRLVSNVHPKAGLAGNFLDNEKPPAVIIVCESLARSGPFRLINRQVKAKEAQVWIDLSAEEREFQLFVKLRRCKVRFANHIVSLRIRNGFLRI